MSEQVTGIVVGTILMSRQESLIEVSYASLVIREIGTRTKVREEHSRQRKENYTTLRLQDWDELQTGEFSQNAIWSWVNSFLNRNYTVVSREGKL